MCGRFSLFVEQTAIVEVFSVDPLPDVVPRYNIAPTDPVLGIRTIGQERALQWFRWGLVPWWSDSLKDGAKRINARSETAPSRNAFREPFRLRRCLVVADGFYEWRRVGKQKLPIHFRMADERPFAFAGLWDRWRNKETDEKVRTCSILTTEPNELVATVHNRMPVILPREAWDLWLDPQLQEPAELTPLLAPYPASEMKAVEVSTRVNSVRNDDAECVVPLQKALFDS